MQFTLEQLIIIYNSYLKYSEACAHAVRNGLKEELRQVALRRSENVVRYAKWEQGKPSESSTVLLVFVVVVVDAFV